LCRDPAADRMTFVENHQAAFRQSRLLRAQRSRTRRSTAECLLAQRARASIPISSPAPNQPMLWRPQRRRIPRPTCRARAGSGTPMTSYFAAMTYPQGLPSAMQPAEYSRRDLGACCRRSMAAPCNPSAEGHARDGGRSSARRRRPCCGWMRPNRSSRAANRWRRRAPSSR